MGVSEFTAIDELCRLCKSKNQGLTNIFKDTVRGQKYVDHIQDLLNIEVCSWASTTTFIINCNF